MPPVDGPIGGVRFASRRSTVYARRGAIATSRPLAATAGLAVLQGGGNAFDGAVAAAAVLAVVDPLSTGLGGDGFALCWQASDPKVHALNASGRAPRAARLEDFRARFGDAMPRQGINSVTVPGVVDGWQCLLDRFGTMPLARLLEPAIYYAAEGFPVPEIFARQWEAATPRLSVHPNTARTLLPGGRAPRTGEMFRQLELANTLRQLAAEGRDAFYEGDIAARIVAFSEAEGGLLTRDDFRSHRSSWVEPITTRYRGLDVYECPPNGQGLIVLLALGILEGFDLSSLGWGSAQHLHILAETLKLAYADGYQYVSDPEVNDIPLDALLSEWYAAARRARISPDRVRGHQHGYPLEGDTIYLTTVDEQGNVCSLINSLSLGFGSGLIAGDTGIILQNRGSGFRLDPSHRNRLEGGKRPYHTIIPAMVLKDGRPWLTYGVVGGFMQPAGHVEVLSNLVDFGMSPQEALDAPRLRVERDGTVAVEEGFDGAALAGLRDRGHPVAVYAPMTLTFGGGQAILIDQETGVLAAASEPRWDGLALGY
jgi:gamma-glutamyltranspeptidase/glutathione hydrolase